MQKTAYEMRISDWSSDVCSSDLSTGVGKAGRPGQSNKGRGRTGRKKQREVDLPRGERRGNAFIERFGGTGIVQNVTPEVEAGRPQMAGEVAGGDAAGDVQQRPGGGEIGRAACRERVWQDV